MSAAEAIRRCPTAVFVRPRHALYREYSRHVWSTVRGIVPTVEQTGIDEGYLDLGEVAGDFLEARVVAEAVQTAVRAGTSLTCSLGVAPCKVVAKVGSDARKPGGLLVVVPGQEASFLAPFDVRRLPGVGPKAEERLRAAGVDTVGALAELSDEELRPLLSGSVGRLLRDRARGLDPRGLELDTERISISVENTFERDLVDRERLHDELRGMAIEVAATPAEDGTHGAHRDDEAPLRGFLDPQPLDLTGRRDRRPGADRRTCVPASRPRPEGSPRRAAACRRRRLGPRGLPSTRAHRSVTTGACASATVASCAAACSLRSRSQLSPSQPARLRSSAAPTKSCRIDHVQDARRSRVRSLRDARRGEGDQEAGREVRLQGDQDRRTTAAATTRPRSAAPIRRRQRQSFEAEAAKAGFWITFQQTAPVAQKNPGYTYGDLRYVPDDNGGQRARVAARQGQLPLHRHRVRERALAGRDARRSVQGRALDRGRGAQSRVPHRIPARVDEGET